MKTKLLKFPVGLLLLGFFWVCNPVVAADAALLNSEDLGVDFYQGRTNRIASVYDVTPTHVRVRYENGNLSRPIPRTELSGELARRFPYEADKASAYLAQKSAEAAQRAVAQQLAWQEAQRRRDQAVDAEIERLITEDARLQAEVNILEYSRAGNGRKVRMLHLMDQQILLRQQIARLRTQRSGLR